MDYQKPDYTAILKRRALLLRRLRSPEGRNRLPGLRAFYRDNPIQFVSDWGVTFDPRNVERGLPALIPFVPFEAQTELMQWMLERWRGGQSGLIEKSRDMGGSVAIMSLFCALALFQRGFTAGVGSRKEMLVDRLGDPNTLFYKARLFLEHVPHEFRSGWTPANKEHNTYMLLRFPHTGAVILGEAGENIGRGGRTSMYLTDEDAFMRNQMSVEAALSQTTRCRISLSSINGSDNLFAEKRHSGRVPVFTLHWRRDPRKDQAWYDAECARLPAVVVAQEIDIDYNASKDGILIPQVWVQAAVAAPHESGERSAALDVADEGIDKNAWAARDGTLLTFIEEWSGKASDIFATSERAALLCDTHGISSMQYDADGLGAGVRGDMRVINERPARANAQVTAVEYRGSGEVVRPDEFAIEPDHKRGHNGRTNKDFFSNRKAQSWWAMRRRFEKTYQRVIQGQTDIPLADCISIPANLPHLSKLTRELSQVVYTIDNAGKIKIDKAPDGMPSPNLADSVVILFAPQHRKRRGILDF
jgi:phage terminase large subunit